MILIIGQTEDDILYFAARFTESGSRVDLPGGLVAYRGKFGNEEVAVSSVGSSNVVSSMNTAALIDHYDPYLVINVGGALAIDETLKKGDLVLAERYFAYGVDHGVLGDYEYGQIPGYPTSIAFSTDLNSTIKTICYDLTDRYLEEGYILSGEKVVGEAAQMERIIKDHYLSIKSMLMAYDTSSMGVALACSSRNVSLLSIRVIAGDMKDRDDLLSYNRTVLEAMPDVGAILAEFIISKENQFELMEDK